MKDDYDIKMVLREIMDSQATLSADPCMFEGCEEPKDGQKFCTEHRAQAMAIWEADKIQELRVEREGKVDEFIAESLGRTYTRCTWDGLDQSAAIKKRMRDTVSSGGSVILVGEPGRGKTHAMACLIRDLYIDGRGCEVWTCADLFDHLRSLAMSDDRNARKKFIDHFREVEWAFFDDLGVGKDSEFALEQLFRIIDWRSRDGLPVVVTSNLSMDELGEKYDRRLSSRLAGLVKQEGGFGATLLGPDYRKGVK